MKIIATILIVSLFTLTCNSQELDCKKFKNGLFYYPTLPEKTSIRKDSIQESYNNGKLEMIWKVRWLTECEYEIICDKVLIESIPIRKGDRIVAKIVKTEGNCFTSELKFYNSENPEGLSFPAGELCIKKD
jgi:hypothetical protein